MSTKTTRLSVDMPTKDHRKLKLIANAYGMSLREFILGLVDPILHPEKKPNKDTIRAMTDASEGKNLTAYKDIDDFLKKMGIE